MQLFRIPQSSADRRSASTSCLPHIVVGITHSQTCLVLTGRLRALREAGFTVTLVSSPGDLLTQTARREGVDFIPLPIERGIAPLADLVSLARLWLLLRRLKPAMTEFSTPKAGLLGTVAAMLCGVPQRIYMLRGLKLESCTGPKRWILLLAEKLTAACAHVVLCNSPSLRAKAVELQIASEAKLHLLGEGSSNGIDAARFSPGPNALQKQLGIPVGAPVIGFVGRLTCDKGVPELLDAFDMILESIPTARLLLVGWFDHAEDALPESARRRILSHPQIIFTGYAEDTVPYYRTMDVMVLPTLREGFPNAVLEAASCGIAVVTTLSTGSRDAVVPEVTGLLIPPGYAEAIAEAVLALLRDPERRLKMGAAARLRVLEHFQDQHVLKLTMNFYRSLLDPSPRETAIGAINELLADQE